MISKHLFESLVNTVTQSIELLGIAVLVIGTIGSLYIFAKDSLKRHNSFYSEYKRLRKSLGRTILLALEFLVAADIVHTVVIELNFTSVGVLGLLVVIRTFLSFSLEVELEGNWPWQQSKEQAQSLES